MKKIIMTIVATMSMTMAFAGNRNANVSNENNAYDIHCNMRRLATTLGLDLYQMESVDILYNTLRNEVLSASEAADKEKSEKVDKAVDKNFEYMSYVLDKKQYQKYTTLVNTTLKNRGLKK